MIGWIYSTYAVISPHCYPYGLLYKSVTLQTYGQKMSSGVQGVVVCWVCLWPKLIQKTMCEVDNLRNVPINLISPAINFFHYGVYCWRIQIYCCVLIRTCIILIQSVLPSFDLFYNNSLTNVICFWIFLALGVSSSFSIGTVSLQTT